MKPEARIFNHSSERMPELASASVQLLFESPPYEKMHPCCKDSACLSCYAGKPFVERFQGFLAERLRVLVDSGSYVLNFQPQVIDGFLSPSAYLMPQAVIDSGFQFVEAYVWYKPNSAPFALPQRLKSAYELLWHFAKSKDYRFNKDAVRQPHQWAEKDSRQERYHPKGKDPGNFILEDHEGNIVASPKSQDQARMGHPGKMKDGIASRFIKLLSSPGDLVLDGFAGTGQTGIEALALERRFVGYELHGERVKQAEERLEIEGEDKITKPWLDAQETAEYLGLSKATIYSKTSRGEMPSHKNGRIVRYHRDELDSWLRGNPVKPTEAR